MYEASTLKRNAHRFAGGEFREEIIINKINFSGFGIRDGKALASRCTHRPFLISRADNVGVSGMEMVI